MLLLWLLLLLLGRSFSFTMTNVHTQKQQQQQQQQQHQQIVLIALEGTWRNARRMLTKLGPIGRLTLSEQDIHGWRHSTSSLRPQASSGQACTAEAVVSALVALGLEKSKGLSVLKLVEKKMDLTKRYQGHDWKNESPTKVKE